MVDVKSFPCTSNSLDKLVNPPSCEGTAPENWFEYIRKLTLSIDSLPSSVGRLPESEFEFNSMAVNAVRRPVSVGTLEVYPPVPYSRYVVFTPRLMIGRQLNPRPEMTWQQGVPNELLDAMDQPLTWVERAFTY